MKARSVLVVAMLAVSGTTFGDGVEAYDAVPAADRDWYVQAYQGELARLEAALESAEKEKRKYKSGTKRKNAERQVAELRDQVEAVKKNDPPIVPLFVEADDVKAGRFGRLWPGANSVGVRSLMVEQVIGDGEVLVVPTFAYVSGVSRLTGRPIQQIDFRKGKPWLLSGIDTTNVTDRTEFNINEIFYVSGTETYETVIGGTNTVFALRRVDPEDALKAVKPEDEDSEDGE